MPAVVLLLVLALSGCFSVDYCDIDSCPTPAPSCEGVCVPYVGGGWTPVLVPASTSASMRCPEVAPFAAMSSSVVACGVREAPGTCGSQAWECLPVASDAWRACIVRDGEHECPSPYPVAIDVTDAAVSLCCPRDAPPA